MVFQDIFTDPTNTFPDSFETLLQVFLRGYVYVYVNVNVHVHVNEYVCVHIYICKCKYTYIFIYRDLVSGCAWHATCNANVRRNRAGVVLDQLSNF